MITIVNPINKNIELKINGDVNDAEDALFKQVDLGIYFVDRQRKITYWSREAEAITG